MCIQDKITAIRYRLMVLMLLASVYHVAAQIRIDSVHCTCGAGNPGRVFITAEGNAGPFSFVWQGPEGYSAYEPNPQDLPTPGQYSVTVTNAYGCAVTLEAQVPACDGVPEVELTPEPACPDSENGRISTHFSRRR
ncbi:MAG: hypothetical protein KF852_03690 [Saprospiraceae bacterium]|nr:hypothetical protein [Saprospiraceae bacterium]